MSIKPIYTDHEAHTGLKFELSGEAQMARHVAVTEDLLEILIAMRRQHTAIPFAMSHAAREILIEALKHYWSTLGVLAEKHVGDDAEDVEDADAESELGARQTV